MSTKTHRKFRHKPDAPSVIYLFMYFNIKMSNNNFRSNIMIVFNIRNVRKNRKISLRKLSDMTGISRAYLYDLENNRRFNPTLFILQKIAEVLEVNIKDLFYSLNDIDNLKEEMYRRIDEYGIDSKEVLEVSQVIDLLINIKMKRD